MRFLFSSTIIAAIYSGSQLAVAIPTIEAERNPLAAAAASTILSWNNDEPSSSETNDLQGTTNQSSRRVKPDKSWHDFLKSGREPRRNWEHVPVDYMGGRECGCNAGCFAVCS